MSVTKDKQNIIKSPAVPILDTISSEINKIKNTVVITTLEFYRTADPLKSRGIGALPLVTCDPFKSDSSGLACYNFNNYVTNAVQGQKR